MTSPENPTQIRISVHPFNRQRKSDQDFHFVDVQPPLSEEEIDGIVRRGLLIRDVFSQILGQNAVTQVMVEWTDDDYSYRDVHYDHTPETKAQNIAKGLGAVVREIRDGEVIIIDEPVQVSGTGAHSFNVT